MSNPHIDRWYDAGMDNGALVGQAEAHLFQAFAGHGLPQRGSSSA